MSNDGYITAENIESSKEHFRLVLKKLKMLDDLGIKWIPRRWDYAFRYDTYDMEILLPEDNAMIVTRVKIPKFDDGQSRFYDWRYTGLVKIDENGNKIDEWSCTIPLLFEVLKERHERGDALFQNYEYRKAHGEDFTHLKYHKLWQEENGVK